MAIGRDGKYRKLYEHLASIEGSEWRASFGEIERIIGASLPASARCRYWWANVGKVSRRVQSDAWRCAGWETVNVDLSAETVLFRVKNPDAARKANHDEAQPGLKVNARPEALSLQREGTNEGLKARQSKYQRLYTHLCGIEAPEWRTSFVEIEAILGFPLPPSARRYRPWWANGNSHTQAISWIAAGWIVAGVDMAAGTLLFRRRGTNVARKSNLNETRAIPSAGARQEERKAPRGKYQRLYAHLCGIATQEWRTSFGEIEAILDSALPPSARRYQVWWSNNDDRHSQSIAWIAAGWEAADVNLGAETVVFRRRGI